MKDQLKAAFDQIQADDALCQRTAQIVMERARRPRFAATRHPLLAAAALIILFAGGGWWLFFKPTAVISLDVNPSLELKINRFDQVIALDARNEDGRDVSEQLQVFLLSYTDALQQILDTEPIRDLLADEEILTITVIGPEGSQSTRLLKGVQSCTADQKNAFYYCAHHEEVSEAHQLGLSYGKYLAYLELVQLDPDVTIQQVQSMTMREIRDRIAQLSDPDSSDPLFSPGQGNGHRHGAHHNE